MVELITQTHIGVRVTRLSACAGCGLAGHCGASECRRQLVMVPCDKTEDYAVGDRVCVYTTQGSVRTALWAGFGLPLLLLLAGVGIAIGFLGYGEAMAALAGVGVLIPYYILLYLVRRRIGRRVEIGIERL